MPTRRGFILGLTGLVAGIIPVCANSENSWINPEVWNKIVDGHFAEAIAAIDLQIAGYRYFKDAGFVRAKLIYGLTQFAAANQEFESLARRRRHSSKDNSYLQYAPEVDDVRAWVYFSQGRMGRSASLPQSSPQELLSLLRGDTTRDAYVRTNIDIWQQQIEDMNAKRPAPPDDGGSYLVAKFVLPGESQRNLEFIADFAMAQKALIQRDGRVARALLQRAVASDADNAVEFHIAKKQLSDLA